MLRISNGVMTMTSNVRREIAERMRGPFDVCECEGHTYLNGTLFGMQVCARDEMALRDGMRRLADLIDPTCTVEMQVYSKNVCNICSVCGETINTYMRFCPHCGARVVDWCDG